MWRPGDSAGNPARASTRTNHPNELGHLARTEPDWEVIWGDWPMRILLVDDDAGLRALLRTTFEAVDVDLEEAEDAPSAIDALRRQRPDVVVLDVRMPGGSGLDLCRDLKTDPATDGIAVVLLTGSDGGTAAEAAAAGADAFLR